MEDLRLAVRKLIDAGNSIDDFTLKEDGNLSLEQLSLYALWADVAAHNARAVHESLENENLQLIHYVLRECLRVRPLEAEDKTSAKAICSWLAQLSLPSPEFAASLEASYSADKENKSDLSATLKKQQATYTRAISCIKCLNDILPLLEVANSEEVFMTLLCFTSPSDPWTTSNSHRDAVSILQSYMKPETRLKCWSLLEGICESKIRPIFAKTKNPAITASGRKNLHPLPQPKFDESLFDPEAKPWKHKDVYATTVLEWILAQYTSSDINRLENQFHLYIPPILSLIDDESLAFKYRGCKLLINFLTPIQESDSDLLKRTNLSSVFDDAVTPCLLSLPTITPEDEALHLLGVAYPALLLTLKTRYHIDRNKSANQTVNKADDQKAYTTRLVALLRDNVISSFHHVSASSTSANEELSSLASFPFPKLSTFLLHQLTTVIQELGIHTTKFLQEIVPVIYSTLSNPFGTAYVPLLLAGVATTQAVILNAHPRIWRYRADFLAAICQCWIDVSRDESNNQDSEQKAQLRKVLSKLQGAVYLLKLSVQAVSSTKMGNEQPLDLLKLMDDMDDKDISIDDDVKALVDADAQLNELLQIDVDVDLDDDYFFE